MLTGTRGLCKAELGVRFPPPPWDRLTGTTDSLRGRREPASGSHRGDASRRRRSSLHPRWSREGECAGAHSRRRVRDRLSWSHRAQAQPHRGSHHRPRRPTAPRRIAWSADQCRRRHRLRRRRCAQRRRGRDGDAQRVRFQAGDEADSGPSRSNLALSGSAASRSRLSGSHASCEHDRAGSTGRRPPGSAAGPPPFARSLPPHCG